MKKVKYYTCRNKGGREKVSTLKEQNFGFGAGLTALFDNNPDIMPSFIEDVTAAEINGKKTKVTNGKFLGYKLQREMNLLYISNILIN